MPICSPPWSVRTAGRVTGIDMTAEQLTVARRHQDYHRHAFGHSQTNVTFHEDRIEDLTAVGIGTASQDIVVSNCALNLSPDKPAVMKEVWRGLSEGGEFYFSDVYTDRRIPEPLRADPLLYGKCLSGALY